MAVVLPMPAPFVLGIPLNRSRRNFSEQDRLLLNLLHPHLTQAYRNAEAVTRLQQEMAQLRRTVDESDGGIILLAGNGRVRLMTERAWRWVEDYFGISPYQADNLPDMLQRWVAFQEAPLVQDTDVPPPLQPLVVEHEGKRLVVRLIAERASGRHLMLLEEERLAPRHEL